MSKFLRSQLFSPKLKWIYILIYRSTPTKSCTQVHVAVAIRAVLFSFASHTSFNILERIDGNDDNDTDNKRHELQRIRRKYTSFLRHSWSRASVVGKSSTYLMPEMYAVNILRMHRVLSNATYIRAAPFHLSKHRCFTRCSRGRYSTRRPEQLKIVLNVKLASRSRFRFHLCQRNLNLTVD